MPTSTTDEASTASDPLASVRQALESIAPTVTMWRDGLTVIPLASALPNTAPEYLTLDQAHEAGAIAVEEAPVHTVPTVDATTKAAPVLLLGGDTIIGGAQNRIINITILLKAAARTAIPVSCLEAHRWDQGRRFAAARPVDHALRSMVAEQVTHARRRASPAEVPAPMAFAADQGAIWDEIGHRQARAAHHSRTEALHEVYEREADTVDELVRAFPMPAGSRGVAIGLHDRLVGLDLFDSAETLERQWPRLIGGAASALLDRQRAIAAGVEPKPRHRHLHHESLGRLTGRALDALTDAIASPSVGLGHDVRFDGPRVVGTALVHDGRTIHLALFRREA